MMRNMAQRLFKGKRLIYLSIILLALVLLNLGLSVIMRWQKQETCESIADVWKDVGHLVLFPVENVPTISLPFA